MTNLINGKTPGSTGMNRFTSQNHAAGTYTHNPDWFAAALGSQLQACAALKFLPNYAWSSGAHQMQSYGGVLITPRHVLYCHHAHPHAEGTWSVRDLGPQKIRFVKADNTVVDVVQLAQSEQPSSSWTDEQITAAEASTPGFVSFKGELVAQGDNTCQGYVDLCVALIDTDLTTHGINPVPIMQERSLAELIALRYDNDGNHLPVIHMTQGAGRVTSSVPPTPISDYPQYNEVMAAIGPPQKFTNGIEGFDYAVWDGDSGTPTFVLHDGDIYLDGIAVSQPFGRVSPGLYYEEINQMIAAADAGAIALGRLSTPTGYTVTPTELPAI